MEDVRAELISKGWLQGSCIEVEKIAELQEQVTRIDPDKLSQFIAISVLYDCALVCPSFDDEPYAHFVLLRELDGPEARFLKGKEPRKLHVLLNVSGDEIYYEAIPMGLMIIERSILLTHVPSVTYDISDEQMNILTHWLSRRYRTPSFPDKFNNRLNKKKIDKLFKKYDDITSGLYIKVHPMKEELQDGQPYNVSVITAVDNGILRKLKADKIEDEINMAIKALFPEKEGFSFDYHEVIEEGSITLTMLREYKLWSPEYYTHRGDAQDLPVETIDSGTL